MPLGWGGALGLQFSNDYAFRQTVMQRFPVPDKIHLAYLARPSTEPESSCDSVYPRLPYATGRRVSKAQGGRRKEDQGD